MSKKLYNANVTVIVDVSCPDWRGQWDSVEQARRYAEDTANEIKRHIDMDYALPSVEAEYVCEHCGWAWNPDEGESNECCQEEIEEHEKRMECEQ